jgi:DNA-binding NarL/FixJ family response regulator
MYLVTGRLDEAEDELQRAIGELEASGMQSRCVHPVTQLAELRVLQGRFEEARAMLESFEDLAEAIRPLAVLDLALGDPESAAVRLQRRVDEVADVTVGSLPLHTVLIDAYVALADHDGARRSVRVLEAVAAATRSTRHEGEALFASGKLLAATGDAGAPDVLRAAAMKLSEASMALTACRARMELARTLAESDKPLAISEARAALAAFERLGAVPDADSAAAFLRELGIKGRTGPKNLDLLTKRETEVLRLVAQGFSNGEIAERLFISIKTAGHHVSNILSKLGLRSRTEAAAFASIHLPSESAPR